MNIVIGSLAVVSWVLLTLSGSPWLDLQPPAAMAQTQKAGGEQVNNATLGEYPLDTLALKSVLPLPKELPGQVRAYSSAARVNADDPEQKDDVERGVQFHASFSGYRKEGTNFNVNIHIYNTPDAALKAALRGIVLAGGELDARSYSGRRIGERVWSSPDWGMLMILDDRTTLSVSINEGKLRDGAGNLIRDAQGKPVPYQITADDTRLEERLAVDTLERLTVLGVTSRPASKATARARDQVKARRDELTRKP